ncbi:MAG: cyanophycinase [Ferruginibacter sp.]
MKINTSFSILFYILLSALTTETAIAQQPGSLFIIGGGDRTYGLMQSLKTTAQLKDNDYIVILPMSGENPDTSFYYIKEDLRQVFNNPVVNFNFTKEKSNDISWLDSLEKAKLIFITGGDQNRFMNIVLHTPIYDAIKKAFKNGGTVAGTSAGAAVMSEKMITGNELIGDSAATNSFTKIRHNMVEIKEGLGLVKKAVIDQHFIVRSRYNRLLSVLAANPSLECIGIDEATAVIIKGQKVTVAGESQVIRLRIANTKNTAPGKKDMIRMENARLDILTAGDVFMLK